MGLTRVYFVVSFSTRSEKKARSLLQQIYYWLAIYLLSFTVVGASSLLNTYLPNDEKIKIGIWPIDWMRRNILALSNNIIYVIS